jgi:3-phenylpropionate/trans-cinnamate dioxygenase ferredoxin reductase subunit
MFTPILVVGAGQAAAQAVETLRKKGHVGPLTVVGDENMLPYQRPPLSKKYLSGAMEKDRLLLRHADHYAQHAVDLHLGFAISNLDATARRVEVTDGSHLRVREIVVGHRQPAASASRHGGRSWPACITCARLATWIGCGPR